MMVCENWSIAGYHLLLFYSDEILWCCYNKASHGSSVGK